MTTTVGYLTAETQFVTAANGVTYAYRQQGPRGGRPLVLLQHFRGNLDNWDPRLVDLLAADRDVVTFDNVGVGATTGRTPDEFSAMATDAIAFLDALAVADVDLLGFSIGSFVAQEIALTRPACVHKLVLASSAPQGAPGMFGWAPDIIAAVGEPVTNAEGLLHAFFTPSAESRAAGGEFLQRIFTRQDGRDADTTWQTRNAQYDAVHRWGTPDYACLHRLAALTRPVFVANGDSDRMILPWYSELLAALLPDSVVKFYPDAAHGFLFQHADEFARDVAEFLDR